KQFDDKIRDKFDEWIYFFKHNSIKDEFTAKGLDRVRETLLYENLTDEEKQEYKRIADVNLQNKNVIYTAECEGEMRGEMKARQEYEPKLAHEREEKEAALATLAREREEKEAALAREREKEAALARAIAELDALKNKK
ncbi:MAG: hypothetical protein LBQ01_08325, partial [Prevotellaceae bacterium]|nr:hypothetical protein [Prevotellaceae bacterium]